MKPLYWLRLLGGLLAGALAFPVRAQVADDAVAVPIHFQGKFDAQTSTDLDNPASMTITAIGVSGSSVTANGTSMGGTGILTSGAFARLRPGRTYLFQLDTYLSTRVQVKITPPAGHRVVINGVEHDMFDWQMGGGGPLDPQGSFSVRLDDGSGSAAGEAASLRPGRLLWSVGLVGLRNGKPAGSLRLAEDGVTANAFKPVALYFDRDSGTQNGSYVGEDGEVIVTKVGNILRQVYAATVLADIMTNDDHSYYIRMYARADVPATADSQGVFDLTGKTPLFEFFIENPSHPSLTAVRITKTTNQDGQLVRWTQMMQQTGQPSGTTQWLVDDWVDKPLGGSAPNSPVRHRWTYSDSDKNEHLRIEDGAGNPVHCVFKRYDDYNFGVETSRELYQQVDGCRAGADTTPANAEIAGSIKTTYSYYTSFADAGNWHKIATVSSTDGLQALFGYRNEFEQRGYIFEVRRPDKNTAPSSPGAGSNGTITTYDYDFVNYFGSRSVTSIQTKVNGTLTARTDFSYAYESITDASATYADSGGANMPLTVVTRKDYTDGFTYLATVTRVYREDADWEFKFFPGLLYSVERPDKSMTAMAYFHSQLQASDPYNPFNPSLGAGARVHVTLQGTKDTGLGSSMTSYNSTAQLLPSNFRVVSGKSALSRVLVDPDGLPKISEQQVYVSSTWTVVRQDWTNYVNGLWPSFTQRRSANIGSYWNVVTNTWTAGRLTTVVDETGLSRTLTYDSVGRLQSDTRASATYGSTTIAAQTFTAAYDAAGRLLSRTTTATTVSGTETLGTAATYDTAGRLLTQSESGRGTTSFVYDVANRIVTATLPTGATRIETRFADGRIASVTGTAQVAEYYDYSVETDGRRKSTFGPATSNHVRTLSAWTDRLGRPLQRSRPGFNNAATYTESMGYDAATGRMNALSRTGYADMRFDSNGVGELTRRGLWVSGGTGLQTASADRITDLDASVESYGGAYWLTSTTKGYATVSNSTATLVETTRQRLTGLSPTLRAETRTTDADGNETIRTVTVNASSPLVTVTTTRTGATNAAIEFSLAGFAISSTGFDGVTTTSAYDSLGRRTSTTDPRTGTSTTHYQANTPLVDYVKDAANNQTATYTYDSAGRVTAVSDVAGKLTRTAYNTRNQVIRQWGAAAMPVEYAYNTLGERTAMRTIRSGDFTGSSWPLGDSGLDGTTGTPDPSV